MAEGWLSTSEVQDLQRLGWEMTKPPDEPVDIPEKDYLPVDDRLDHLLVDVKLNR